MSERRIVIEHNGTEYGGQIGKIRSTSLGYMDHGVLSAWVQVEWVGGGIGVGGFVLDEPKDRDGRDYSRRGTAYGLDHVIRLMETVGVSKWEEMVGKHVIVLFKGKSYLGSQSVGVASATDESLVFIPSEHAAEWRAEDAS